jgi:hypothetical protein
MYRWKRSVLALTIAGAASLSGTAYASPNNELLRYAPAHIRTQIRGDLTLDARDPWADDASSRTVTLAEAHTSTPVSRPLDTADPWTSAGPPVASRARVRVTIDLSDPWAN